MEKYALKVPCLGMTAMCVLAGWLANLPHQAVSADEMVILSLLVVKDSSSR